MLPYTAIYQNSAGEIKRYTAQASNDKKQAWAQLSHMKEDDGECLILLVPGDHPVVQYLDTIDNKQIDLFDNLSPDSSVG
tara:strand:+ start:310 stop:549 length:240 start_codon:yes stop_codon:yes gene_type:complete